MLLGSNERSSRGFLPTKLEVSDSMAAERIVYDPSERDMVLWIEVSNGLLGSV